MPLYELDETGLDFVQGLCQCIETCMAVKHKYRQDLREREKQVHT